MAAKKARDPKSVALDALFGGPPREVEPATPAAPPSDELAAARKKLAAARKDVLDLESELIAVEAEIRTVVESIGHHAASDPDMARVELVLLRIADRLKVEIAGGPAKKAG